MEDFTRDLVDMAIETTRRINESQKNNKLMKKNNVVSVVQPNSSYQVNEFEEPLINKNLQNKPIIFLKNAFVPAAHAFIICSVKRIDWFYKLLTFAFLTVHCYLILQ